LSHPNTPSDDELNIAWSGPPIEVVGLGICSDYSDLPAAHRHAIENAAVIIGSERHLTLLPALDAAQLCYPSPFSGLAQVLRKQRGRRVVLLASGDPLFFGVGGWLSRHLAPAALRFHSNISSVQAAFARIGVPWQEASVVSLHGRPLNSLKARLRSNQYYALLTDTDNHPAAIAAALCDWGQASARCWVMEAIGSKHERLYYLSAAELALMQQPFDELNLLLLQTNASVAMEFPGIDDSVYVTDTANNADGSGMISKREVRLMILSLLQPGATELGWDIGAGCGGVAIEWARWNRLGRVVAIENCLQRLNCLQFNREQFGVAANLSIVAGSAPDCLAELADPDCVFVGGGGRQLNTILDQAWRRLKPGGRLVAAAVTEPSRALLQRFATNSGSLAEWSQIAISRARQLGGQLVLKPRLPVLLMKCIKPVDDD